LTNTSLLFDAQNLSNLIFILTPLNTFDMLAQAIVYAKQIANLKD